MLVIPQKVITNVFEIFKEDTYISEYPLTMGCKVKSVAMAAAASNVMVADHNAGGRQRKYYVGALNSKFRKQ